MRKTAAYHAIMIGVGLFLLSALQIHNIMVGGACPALQALLDKVDGEIRG